jgi:glycosyltransferase involved in cell wall biosynthesis
VGDVNWNKNIPGLIESFALLKKNQKDIELVLVGNSLMNKDLKEVVELDGLTQKHNLGNSVHKLGFVPVSDLVQLYNNAIFYAQVSWSEGFGIPVLEAMSCGTPVVVSRAGSLPEVAGDAGYYCNPGDPKDISNIFEKILSLSSSANLEARKNSLKQAAQFSMEKFARDTIHVYEMVFQSTTH